MVSSVAIIPVVLVFMVPLIALGLVVAGVVLVVRAFLRRGEGARLTEEESESLRRLMASMERMEGRIVNLETILLERGSGAEQEREQRSR